MFSQKMSCNQQLAMTQAMQCAFFVLQLPILELSLWLENQLLENPAVELRPRTLSAFSKTIEAESIPSTYETFMSGAPLYLLPEEIPIASQIFGSLTPQGFLEEEVPDSRDVLAKIRAATFPNLGAMSIQESFLLQLPAQSLPYTIIKHSYEDFLHQRFNKIARDLTISLQDVLLAVDQIKNLSPYPLTPTICATSIIPDITISQEGAQWKISLPTDMIPSFYISQQYQNMKELRPYITAAKWLNKIVSRRHQLLIEVARYLIAKGALFLEGGSNPSFSLSELAQALNISESTASRTISNKYIATPRGVLSLKKLFFSRASAKELLLSLIKEESTPLTDKELAELLKSYGIPCSRRTVAKYRQDLGIATQLKREESRRKDQPLFDDSAQATPE